MTILSFCSPTCAQHYNAKGTPVTSSLASKTIQMNQIVTATTAVMLCNKVSFTNRLIREEKGASCTKLASMVPIAPDVAMPSMPPKATAGARQAKNRKNTEDSTYTQKASIGVLDSSSRQ